MGAQFKPAPLEQFPRELRAWASNMQKWAIDVDRFQRALITPTTIQSASPSAGLTQRVVAHPTRVGIIPEDDPPTDETEFAGTIFPHSSCAFDIGTSSRKWRDMYLCRNAYIDGTGNMGLTGKALAAPSFTFGTANVAGGSTATIASNATIALFGTQGPLGDSTTAIAGTSAFAAHEDHQHRFPQTIKAVTASTGEITLTDSGTRQTLTFDRASVTFAGINTDLTLSSTAGGLIINGTGTALSANAGGIVGKKFNLSGSGAGFGIVSDWFPTTDNLYELGDGTTPRRWLRAWFTSFVSAAGGFSGTVIGGPVLGVTNFAAPTVTYAVTGATGVLTTVIQSDAVLPFPTMLQSSPSGLTWAATDSLGSITMTSPGSIRLVASGTGNIQLVDNTAVTGSLTNTQGCTLTSSAGDVVLGRGAGGNIVPDTTNVSQCGTSSKRWSAVNSVLGNFTGNLTMGPGTNIAADDISANDIAAATVASGTVAVNGAGGFSIADVSNGFNLFMSAEGGVTGLDRTLTWDMGGANRTITLSGSPTLADWFNQSVKTTADVVFAGLSTTSNTAIGDATSDTLRINAGSSASFPSTTAGTVITNFYGTTSTNYLGMPNKWTSVIASDGNSYKIPMYS